MVSARAQLDKTGMALPAAVRPSLGPCAGGVLDFHGRGWGLLPLNWNWYASQHEGPERLLGVLGGRPPASVKTTWCFNQTPA